MSSSSQIFIGELARGVTPEDLREEFREFGRITTLSFKGRYAFIEYEEVSQAEKAVDQMDNQKILGSRIVVEFASKYKNCLH